MIQYTQNIDEFNNDLVQGFFVGWPNPPSSEIFLKLLKNSERVLAFDESSKQLVGFITAVTDGVLSAYIPLLEVLPAYQKKGIGKELVNRMIDHLKNFYRIDLICDEDLIPFYEGFSMSKSNGMILRNYERQSGQ